MSCYSNFIPEKEVKGTFINEKFDKKDNIFTPDKKETKIKINENALKCNSNDNAGNNNNNKNNSNNNININLKNKILLSSNSSNFENTISNNFNQNTNNNSSVNVNNRNTSNNDKPKDVMYKCNICYLQPGTLILSCYCLYCKSCLGNHIKANFKNCLMCGDLINLKVTKDLNKKENYEKYNFIFIEPEKLFQQGLESQKFQARYKDKQIKFLESKVYNQNQNQNHIQNINQNANFHQINNDIKSINIDKNTNLQSNNNRENLSNDKYSAKVSLSRIPPVINENISLANPRKISPKMMIKEVTNTNNSLKSGNTKIENLNSRTSKMLSGSTLNTYNSTSKRNVDLLNTEKPSNNNNNTFQENIFENKNSNISNYKINVSKVKVIEGGNNLDSKSVKFNKVEVNKQANNYFTTPMGNYNRDFADYYYK